MVVVVTLCSLSQVAMNDLSPAGPIQAVEILMESPSLADMCRMHHAVIRRIQVRAVPRGCAAGPGDGGHWASQGLGTQPGTPGGFVRRCHVAGQPSMAWPLAGLGRGIIMDPAPFPVPGLGSQCLGQPPALGTGPG